MHSWFGFHTLKYLVYAACSALLLSGCAAAVPGLQLLTSDIINFPLPPVKPLMAANAPHDGRQVVVNGLQDSGQSVAIGQSVLGKSIRAYRFGNGTTGVVLVGGLHGGSEANTVTLAERFIDVFQESTEVIPESISLYIIPAMNPDGFTQRGLEGRVNANQVDLNRNWDCRWMESTGLYKGSFYKTGTRAFSEPENRAVRNFVDYVNAKVVIFYHSHGGFIFYGDCDSDDGSLELARSVRAATGYPIWNPAYSLGDPNQPQITGDATDYFDRIGLLSIGIELRTTDVNNVDWDQSYSGLLAILRLLPPIHQNHNLPTTLVTNDSGEPYDNNHEPRP